MLRAAACGLITLLAIGTGRRRSLIPALAGAVVLLVLFDPWLARSFGFLLSVLATGALLTLAPRWSAALRARRVPGRLAEVLAAAAAAQAVCAPVVVVLASRVSLVAVPCNLLAEFAVAAPATVLGFAALAVAPVAQPVAELLASIASWPVGWIATVARAGAGLPGAEAQWPGGWSGAALLAGLTVAAVLGAEAGPPPLDLRGRRAATRAGGAETGSADPDHDRMAAARLGVRALRRGAGRCDGAHGGGGHGRGRRRHRPRCGRPVPARPRGDPRPARGPHPLPRRPCARAAGRAPGQGGGRDPDDEPRRAPGTSRVRAADSGCGAGPDGAGRRR